MLCANYSSALRHDVRTNDNVRVRNLVVQPVVKHILRSPGLFFRWLEYQN